MLGGDDEFSSRFNYYEDGDGDNGMKNDSDERMNHAEDMRINVDDIEGRNTILKVGI